MVMHFRFCRLIEKCSNLCTNYAKRNPRENFLRFYVALPRLTPEEVTDILQTNEFSKEIEGTNIVKHYESNQLGSNNPIEDTRSEAKCLLTGGILFGVFDGHGGGACAQVVSKRLFQYISTCLLPHDLLKQYVQSVNTQNELELIETYEDNVEFVTEIRNLYRSSFLTFTRELSETQSGNEILVDDAIEKAFLRLDNDLSNEALSELNRRDSARTLSVAMSGSVAVVAHIKGPHLHVAGVGDCQAILGVLSEDDAWTAKALTVEHNFDNLSEVTRILSEHPANEKTTVIKMERLLGQLAPLRALGDFRYKWSKEILENKVVPFLGENAIPPNYHTPPYLTAKPEIKYHRLRPCDKFLILGSDGLWDLMTPLQAVKLVGEHMRGKVTLTPLKLSRKNIKLSEINKKLLQRKEGLKMKPLDGNAATHLLRNALGSTEFGIDHGKLSQYLTLPSEVVRVFRDDITITIVYLDSNFISQSL